MQSVIRNCRFRIFRIFRISDVWSFGSYPNLFGYRLLAFYRQRSNAVRVAVADLQLIRIQIQKHPSRPHASSNKAMLINMMRPMRQFNFDLLYFFVLSCLCSEMDNAIETMGWLFIYAFNEVPLNVVNSFADL